MTLKISKELEFDCDMCSHFFFASLHVRDGNDIYIRRNNPKRERCALCVAESSREAETWILKCQL